MLFDAEGAYNGGTVLQGRIGIRHIFHLINVGLWSAMDQRLSGPRGR